MSSRTYLRELQGRLLERLEQRLRWLGFVRQGQLFLRHADEDVTQMIHVNLAIDKRSEQATAIVSIAVRHERVEKLVMGWRSDLSAREKRHVATVGQEIGIVSDGRSHVWAFGSSSEADSAADEMMLQIQAAGLPYLDKLTDLATVGKMLEEGDHLRHGQYPGGRAQRLPVVKALLEGPEAAKVALRAQFHHLKAIGDPIAREYPAFTRFVAGRLGITEPIEDILGG